MNKEDIEKKLSEIEEIFTQVYVDQMVKTDYKVTHSVHRRFKLLIKDIYWFLDGLED